MPNVKGLGPSLFRLIVTSIEPGKDLAFLHIHTCMRVSIDWVIESYLALVVPKILLCFRSIFSWHGIARLDTTSLSFPGHNVSVQPRTHTIYI